MAKKPKEVKEEVQKLEGIHEEDLEKRLELIRIDPRVKSVQFWKESDGTYSIRVILKPRRKRPQR